MEQLNQVYVCRVRAEVFLEESVDGRFEHEGIVDSNHSDLRLTIPTWLSSTSDAGVHNIVGNEEESLEKLGHPSQRGRFEVLLFGEGSFEEDGDGVWDRHAAITFSSDGVGIERLDIYD